MTDLERFFLTKRQAGEMVHCPEDEAWNALIAKHCNPPLAFCRVCGVHGKPHEHQSLED